MLQRLDSTMPGQGQHLISFALPQATPRPYPSPSPVYHSIHTPQQLANQTNSTHNSHDAVDRANQHKYQKYKSQIESKSKKRGRDARDPPPPPHLELAQYQVEPYNGTAKKTSITITNRKSDKKKKKLTQKM